MSCTIRMCHWLLPSECLPPLLNGKSLWVRSRTQQRNCLIYSDKVSPQGIPNRQQNLKQPLLATQCYVLYLGTVHLNKASRSGLMIKEHWGETAEEVMHSPTDSLSPGDSGFCYSHTDSPALCSREAVFLLYRHRNVKTFQCVGQEPTQTMTQLAPPVTQRRKDSPSTCV